MGKPTSRDPPARPRSPVKPAAVYSLRASARAVEDAIEALPEDNDEDDEMLDDAREHVLPTTEEELNTSTEWSNNLPYSPKRRRVDEFNHPDNVNPAAPVRPSFKHPQAPALQLPKPAPRFAPPQASLTTTIDEGLIQQRPTFLRPSVASQAPTEPLPEAFSPHRRGQKFVPGGMAAMVQQWVIDTGQAAAQGRRGQAHLRGDDSVTRVKMVDVKGDGPIMGTAQLADGETVSVFLTPNAGPLSSRSVDVLEGVVVGIRAPTWNVNIDGGVWMVGVDWKVMT